MLRRAQVGLQRELDRPPCSPPLAAGAHRAYRNHLLFDAHQRAPTRSHTPHILTAPPRVPTWCLRPPLLDVARKIERSDGSRPKGATRPGRRANQPAPPSRGFVWPRGAPYGFRARPWRPLPHPLPRGRLRSGDSSRSGARLASAPARRAAGGWGNRPCRRAVPTNFGWPCARTASQPRPRGANSHRRAPAQVPTEKHHKTPQKS